MEQGYDGIGGYNRDDYAGYSNEIPVTLLPPSQDNAVAVPLIHPDNQLEVAIPDPGDINPPTASNPTFKVLVQAPAIPAAVAASIPWYLWLVLGYGAYKLLGGK